MKTSMSKLINNFVYRPPSGDNNKDEPSLEELLGKLNIKIPKIPGLGSGSPFLGLIIILVIAVLWIASGVYTCLLYTSPSPRDRG